MEPSSLEQITSVPSSASILNGPEGGEQDDMYVCSRKMFIQVESSPRVTLSALLHDLMGSLLDLCAKSIASEPHKYHEYHKISCYNVMFIISLFRSLNRIPSHLADMILEECASQTRSTISPALLRLIVAEGWRISKLTITDQNIDSTFFRSLQKLRGNLTCLDFHDCKFDKVPARSALDTLGQFDNLRSLEFKRCANLTDRHLSVLPGQFWSRIRRLRVSHSKNISLEGVTLSNFDEVALISCDLGASKLLSFMNRLQITNVSILNLSGTLKSSKFFSEHILVLPHVKQLELIGAEIEVLSLLTLPSCFPSLEKLAISLPKRYQSDDSSEIFGMALEHFRSEGISISLA